MSSVLSGFDDFMTSDDRPSTIGSEGSGGGISQYDPRDLIASWMMLDPAESRDRAENDRAMENVAGGEDAVPEESNRCDTCVSKYTSKRHLYIFATIAVVLGVAALTIGIITSGEDSSEPSLSTPTISPPTPTPPSTPTESPPTSERPTTIELLELLVGVSFDSGEALGDATSPQFQAFSWLLADKNLDQYSDERIVQRFALATLYYSTGGDLWSDNSGWLSDDHECKWQFGKWGNGPCGAAGQSVIDLELVSNSLSGTLPREIALLSNSLLYLDLQDNIISGTIPTEVSLLYKLKTFDLNQNHVSGAIPTEIGSMKSLSRLALDGNRISGQMPTTLGQLFRLEFLRLGQNKLNGTVVSELGLLSSLEVLVINDNDLQGSVPSELGLLSSMKELDFSKNHLTGAVPRSVCELNLEQIGVDCKEVACSCCRESCLGEYIAATSTDAGESLSDPTSPQFEAFEWLSLDPNLMDYQPQQIVQRYALSTLYYSTNGDDWDDSKGYLSYDQGECLWGFQDSQKLSIVNASASSDDDGHLAIHAIDQNLKTRWASVKSDPQWIVVDLGESFVLASVELEWETASAAEYRIDVSEDGSNWATVFTEKNGSGGTETVDLSGALGRYVRMYGTERNTRYGYSIYEITVNGIVRPETCDVDANLKQISLSSNNLKGFIPPELALLSDYLEILALSTNQLSSTIPTEIGLLTALQVLDLSSNSLEGVIPSELGLMESLELLLLNENDLEESLPSEIGLLVNLETMVVDENSLTGDVPPGVCDLNLLELRVDCLEVNCTCCEVCVGRANDAD